MKQHLNRNASFLAKIAVITGNVHIEHRREDPGCGVVPTVLHCAVAVFPPLVAPLNALDTPACSLT